jgi:signal peptidase II
VRPPRLRVLIGVALTVLTLDIVSKLLVVARLSGRPPVRLLGGFLHLLVTRNPGAAFSVGTSVTLVFSAIAVAVIVIILRTARRIRSLPWALTLGLLLGGAMGNLVDRMFRYPGLFRGYVVDWIQLPHWPVFNLADSAVVCGGVLVFLLTMRGIPLDGRRDAAAADQPPAGDGHPAAAGDGYPAAAGQPVTAAQPSGEAAGPATPPGGSR